MPSAKLLTAIQDKSLLYQDMVIQGINQFHGTTPVVFFGHCYYRTKDITLSDDMQYSDARIYIFFSRL